MTVVGFFHAYIALLRIVVWPSAESSSIAGEITAECISAFCFMFGDFMSIYVLPSSMMFLAFNVNVEVLSNVIFPSESIVNVQLLLLDVSCVSIFK